MRNERSHSGSADKNSLLKTTPNIKTPLPPRKTDYKPPVRPVVSSHLNNQPARNPTRNPILSQTQNNPGSYRRQTDSASVKSTSADMKKREYSPADKERQRLAMERLTGGSKSKEKAPVNTSSSVKRLGPSSKGKSNAAAGFGVGKKDNAK